MRVLTIEISLMSGCG